LSVTFALQFGSVAAASCANAGAAIATAAAAIKVNFIEKLPYNVRSAAAVPRLPLTPTLADDAPP
jgi:pyridoxal biosynthesis lyase PdxS